MGRRDLNQMEPSELEKRAIELVNTSHVMTLATSGDQGPWSAPVYYIFHKACFYFFSSPNSRHILDSQPSGAASIHESGKSISSLRGLQMNGIIESAGMGLTSAAAFKTYMSDFSSLINVSGDKSKIDSIMALETLFRAKWYRFKPRASYYMDNSIGFGHKQPVKFSG